MKMGTRLRQIVLYGLSRGSADILLAIRGLLLAAILGPVPFGGWILFRLATNYCGFAKLGVGSGLEFEVSRGSAPEKKREGPLYWGTALSFVLRIFGVLAVGLLVASIFVQDPRLASGMRWFAGAILTEQVWLMGLSYLRAKGDLRHYAIYELTNGALQVLFAALLTPRWGLNGAFAGFVLATSVGLVLLSRRVTFRPEFSRSRLRKMLHVGIPIIASVVLGYLLASADRLIVAAYGDMTLLGLYGFAFSIAGIASSLSIVVRVVVFPEVYSEVAEKGEVAVLKAHLRQTVMPFAWVLSPVFGVAAILIGPAIQLIVPEYVDAIPAARLLLFAGITAGFERLGALGVVAAGHQRRLPLFSASALLINVVLSIAALRTGLGLQGVAAAAITSNAAFGLAALGLVARISGARHLAPVLFKLSLPLLWCLLSVLVIGTFLPGLDLNTTVLFLLLFLGSVLPMVPAIFSVVGQAKRTEVHAVD